MKSLRLDTEVYLSTAALARQQVQNPLLRLFSYTLWPVVTHQVSQKLWWPPVLCQTQEPRTTPEHSL